MDLVDIMEAEAAAKHIPLSKDLNPMQGSGNGYEWDWCDAGKAETYLMNISSVEISPDPPVTGRNLTFRGAGAVRGLVTEGSYIDVGVYLGFLRFYSKRLDLCEVLRENDVDVQCPIFPGAYEVEQIVEIPQMRVPPIPFRFKVLGVSQNDDVIACINGRVVLANSFQSWAASPILLLRKAWHSLASFVW